MAQLAPVVALAGTGASIYATARQAQMQKAAARVQAENAETQQRAQSQALAVQAQAGTAGRQAQLERNLASIRARMGASGTGAAGGSAAALQAGLRQDAAEAQSLDDAGYAARLASGRRTLLNTDGSLTTWIRAANSLGGAVKSLLD